MRDAVTLSAVLCSGLQSRVTCGRPGAGNGAQGTAHGIGRARGGHVTQMSGATTRASATLASPTPRAIARSASCRRLGLRDASLLRGQLEGARRLRPRMSAPANSHRGSAVAPSEPVSRLPLATRRRRRRQLRTALGHDQSACSPPLPLLQQAPDPPPAPLALRLVWRLDLACAVVCLAVQALLWAASARRLSSAQHAHQAALCALWGISIAMVGLLPRQTWLRHR